MERLTTLAVKSGRQSIRNRTQSERATLIMTSDIPLLFCSRVAWTAIADANECPHWERVARGRTRQTRLRAREWVKSSDASVCRPIVPSSRRSTRRIAVGWRKARATQIRVRYYVLLSVSARLHSSAPSGPWLPRSPSLRLTEVSCRMHATNHVNGA